MWEDPIVINLPPRGQVDSLRMVPYQGFCTEILCLQKQRGLPWLVGDYVFGSIHSLHSAILGTPIMHPLFQH